MARRFEFYRSEAHTGHEILAAAATGAPAGRSTLRLARQRPAMDPVDELIFLLHTAAEIEHSLLAQYLYAAWSLPDANPQRRWRERLIAIAREEMGHLLSVQNVLVGLGGSFNFEREDYPFNEFYPFPFRLEALSIPMIARVVLAEMPDPSVIPDPDALGFDEAQVRADADEPGDIERVGALFELIIELAEEVGDAAYHNDSLPFQADPAHWSTHVYNLKLAKVRNSAEAKVLLQEIAEQGEGFGEPDTGPLSHFRRLLAIYNEAKAHLAADPGAHLADPVPVNPSVQDPGAAGYLDFPDANNWGVAFNECFHWVLFGVAHLMSLDQTDPKRSTLRQWSLQDMRRLTAMADLLRRLPMRIPPVMDEHGRPIVAGAPLELPHSLSLPDRPVDRWRAHRRIARNQLRQLQAVRDQTTAAPMIAEVEARLVWLAEQIGA